MKETFKINAETRNESGTGANRRLRRTHMVPAVVYGKGEETVSIMVNAHELRNHLEIEAFYSHLLTLNLNGKQEAVILKSLQRHPSEDRILHMDLFRVSEDQEIRVHVPIHFLNEDTCLGSKQDGGVISHIHTNIEISCLPKDLPEYLPVDTLELRLGQSLHFSDIKLPEGVQIVAMMYGDEEANEAVVSVNAPRVAMVEDEEIAAADAESESIEADSVEDEDTDEGSTKK